MTIVMTTTTKTIDAIHVTKMNAREQEENTRHRRFRCNEKLLPLSSKWSQKNTATSSSPAVTAVRSPARSTAFAIAYGRLGFPLATVQGVVDGQRLRWLVPPESVDYDVYLPVLADGLRERPKPYGACATFGLWELLAADCLGDRVLSAVPQTVFPIRKALDVGPRDWPTTVRALKSLQKLSSAGRKGLVGPALVPYYRHLLSPINRYQDTSVIATDGLDANVTYNLSDLCHDTLCVLERTGGKFAYSSIKSIVPTYQNCIAVVGSSDAGSPR